MTNTSAARRRKRRDKGDQQLAAGVWILSPGRRWTVRSRADGKLLNKCAWLPARLKRCWMTRQMARWGLGSADELWRLQAISALKLITVAMSRSHQRSSTALALRVRWQVKFSKPYFQPTKKSSFIILLAIVVSLFSVAKTFRIGLTNLKSPWESGKSSQTLVSWFHWSRTFRFVLILQLVRGETLLTAHIKLKHVCSYPETRPT